MPFEDGEEFQRGKGGRRFDFDYGGERDRLESFLIIFFFQIEGLK